MTADQTDQQTPPTDQQAPEPLMTEEPPTDGQQPAGEEAPEAVDEDTQAQETETQDAYPEEAGDEEASDEEAGPEGAGAEGAEESEEDRTRHLEREGDIAADYLEELLDIADLDGDLDMDVEGDRASVSIVGADLSQLVGRDGEVLEALQELTRLAVHRETGERSRLMLDIGGHRAQRRAALEKVAEDAVEQVRASGEPVALDPMSPFERKVVHDAVAAAGLVSESEGNDRDRHVVVRPA